MVSTTNSLKINVVTIPEEGLNFVFSEGGQWFSERLKKEEIADFDIDKYRARCFSDQARYLSKEIFPRP